MDKVIAGNWKMNHGPDAARAFFQDFKAPQESGLRIALFPPALSLAASRGEAGIVELGVQNVHWEVYGAFTGELSTEMAREAGATLALIGHSERRHVFGETDEEIALKVGAALRGGLEPVVCVGETLEERQAGQLEAVLHRQLDAVVSALSEAPSFMIAYEPVWAIGTGETATPSDASQAHGILRRRMAAAGLPAERTPILYGGSVKPNNARALLWANEVDGVLVGGASLKAEDFLEIAQAGLR